MTAVVTSSMGRHAAAVLAYLAATIALTWPLVLRADAVVPADLGDPLLSIWTLWWNATVTPLTDRWWHGTFFFPGRDTLTLSDHRLGIGLISTPVLWAGGSPVLAYNIAFLASFVLSASAAYALAFALTRRHGAAFIGGLVFGFNPFRAGHLQHLELLCSYWLPVALLALHQWRHTRRVAWLGLLTVALTMQALTSVYYFAFFSVLVGAWLFWFLPRDATLKEHAAVLASVLLPVAAITPILLRYRAAHASMGLSRTIADIEHFSADATGLLAAPQALALWTTPLAWQRAEGALYPGIIAVLIVLAGVLVHRPVVTRAPTAVRRARVGLLALAVLVAAVATVPVTIGPVATEIAGHRISLTGAFKPLSIALLLFVAWLLTTARVRTAWARRSPLAYYALATIAMWAFALGPTGYVMGERFLYKAPYSWLMMLPGVDTAFRVPARFGMLAALTLSAATALAWVRIGHHLAPRGALVATVLAAAAITADSWIKPLELPAAPAAYEVPSGVPDHAVVLELPLGTFEDAAAMYRAITHRRPLVNGLSGYAPPHYQILHSAISDGRVDVLAGIQNIAPLLIYVDRAAGPHLADHLRVWPARFLRATDTHDIFLLPQTNSAHEVASADRLRIQTASASADPVTLALVSDDDRRTAWRVPTQQGTESLTADLGAACNVGGAELTLGAYPGGFPRRLEIATSVDGTRWDTAWLGDVAPLAWRAAIDNPRDVPITIAFAPRMARYMKVNQTGWSAIPWAVAEFRILAR